jgi:hypothetical protein
MAVKVSGDNVILYKIDTSTIPATETVFACARGCTFESQTELAETTSAANAWFKEDKDNLSAWTMSLDGIVTLDNFSYEDIAQAQKDRLLLLTRFRFDNGVDGYRYISGFCFISGYTISGDYKDIGSYSVNLTGSGKYYTDSTPTTTSTTTSTSTTSTSTTTSTTSTSTSTSTTTSTTTTSTTTSTTTTQAPVYYKLYNCATGATEYSRGYISGSFAVNDRVTAIGQTFRIEQVLISDPGGLALTLTATGLTGCPATTSTTTTLPPLTLSLTVLCNNVGTYQGKVVATWSGGSGSGYQIRAGYGFSFSSYRSMGTTQTLTLTSETNPYDGASGLRNTTGGSDIFVVQVIDNNGTGTFNSTSQTTAIACAGTTTTTSTSTTTLPQVWYLLYNCATGATTTSTNYVDNTFQLNDRVTSIGNTYRIDQVYYSNPGGTQLPITATGLTGCPATTTTSTTLAPVDFTISSVCDGIFQDVTISGFTGGNGSYQANDTTYDNASAAIGGTFSAVSGSRFYNNQPGTTNRYVAVKDSAGFGLVVKFVNANCTTTTTTTTTAAPPACSCWTVVNETSETGIYTYEKCGIGTTTENIAAFATIAICATTGTTPYADTVGLTIYSCGTACSINSDCNPC